MKIPFIGKKKKNRMAQKYILKIRKCKLNNTESPLVTDHTGKNERFLRLTAPSSLDGRSES